MHALAVNSCVTMVSGFADAVLAVLSDIICWICTAVQTMCFIDKEGRYLWRPGKLKAGMSCMIMLCMFGCIAGCSSA
jgi:hypothetical protein